MTSESCQSHTCLNGTCAASSSNFGLSLLCGGK
jgi:hypothetical protein